MRALLLASLLLAACGGPSQDQLAWCGDNVDAVHAAFIADLYGEGTPTLPADQTEVGQRMALYFDAGGVPPEGMIESEQSLVDDACATAFGQQ